MSINVSLAPAEVVVHVLIMLMYMNVDVKQGSGISTVWVVLTSTNAWRGWKDVTGRRKHVWIVRVLMCASVNQALQKIP